MEKEKNMVIKMKINILGQKFKWNKKLERICLLHCCLRIDVECLDCSRKSTYKKVGIDRYPQSRVPLFAIADYCLC